MAYFMPVGEPWFLANGISAHRHKRLKNDHPAVSSGTIITITYKITRFHVPRRCDFLKAVNFSKSISDICDFFRRKERCSFPRSVACVRYFQQEVSALSGAVCLHVRRGGSRRLFSRLKILTIASLVQTRGHKATDHTKRTYKRKLKLMLF